MTEAGACKPKRNNRRWRRTGWHRRSNLIQNQVLVYRLMAQMANLAGGFRSAVMIVNDGGREARRQEQNDSQRDQRGAKTGWAERQHLCDTTNPYAKATVYCRRGS